MKVTRQGGRVVTLEGGARLRLEPGAHGSPYDGVCVVELASVLAGEEFSDRPRCVCEVIAGFLRSWNDRAGHFNRQRLLPYASRVIGSRAGREQTRIRRDICLSWAGALPHGGAFRRFLARLAMRFRIALAIGIGPAVSLDQGAGEYAARIAFARDDPDVGFALLDELLAVGSEPGRESATGTGNGHRPLEPHELLNGNGKLPASVNGNGQLSAGAKGNGASAARNGGSSSTHEPVATR
jgi:hypothetical protein